MPTVRASMAWASVQGQDRAAWPRPDRILVQANLHLPAAMIPLLLSVFLALQVVANVLFKYGSLHPGRYWAAFALGNIVGVSSIWFMMQIHQRMNANVAMAVAGGCTFVLVQAALFLLFDSRLNLVQCAGIAAILAGTLVTVLGGDARATG